MSFLRIQSLINPCVAGCGREASGCHALPIFNGDIVSNDWVGEWCGGPCCADCYAAHEHGLIPCADEHYTSYLDHLGSFRDGGGI